jgi:histidyl-tRNA synthetase
MFEQLGGKRTPAVGWGMGIERMLLLLEAVGVAMPAEPVDIYAIVPASEALPAAMVTCEALRSAGVSVQMHAAGAEGLAGMKVQFKKADASGARYAVVFGADELARGEATLKDLRNPATPQAAVPLEPVDALVSRIRSAPPRAS